MKPQTILHAAALCYILATGACTSDRQGAMSGAIHAKMGDSINCGQMVYRVIEAGYRPDIPGAKIPVKARVLAVRLSMNNPTPHGVHSGSFRLIGADGEAHPEFMDLEESPGWLGMLRRVGPNSSDEGIIYFDVPPGVYQLELVDNTNPEKERITLVELPALVAPPPVRTDGPRL